MIKCALAVASVVILGYAGNVDARALVSEDDFQIIKITPESKYQPGTERGVAYAKATNSDLIGCSFLLKEKVPLILYEEVGDIATFYIEHKSCHKFSIRTSSGKSPGIVRNDSLKHAMFYIDHARVYLTGTILDYHDAEIQIVMEAPSCATYRETKDTPYLVRDASGSSSILLGLVYSSKHSAKEYGNHRQEQNRPLTLCVK